MRIPNAATISAEVVDEIRAVHVREGLKDPVIRVDCTAKYRVTPMFVE